MKNVFLVIVLVLVVLSVYDFRVKISIKFGLSRLFGQGNEARRVKQLNIVNIRIDHRPLSIVQRVDPSDRSDRSLSLRSGKYRANGGPAGLFWVVLVCCEGLQGLSRS